MGEKRIGMNAYQRVELVRFVNGLNVRMRERTEAGMASNILLRATRSTVVTSLTNEHKVDFRGEWGLHFELITCVMAT